MASGSIRGKAVGGLDVMAASLRTQSPVHNLWCDTQVRSANEIRSLAMHFL